MVKPHYTFWTVLVLVVGVLLFAVACHSEDTDSTPPPDDPSVPRPLPADVAVYPNGKIDDQAFGADGSFQIRLLTTANADAILAFYVDRLPRMGWRRISTYENEQVFVAYKKGQRVIHLSVSPTDDPELALHTISLGNR